MGNGTETGNAGTQTTHLGFTCDTLYYEYAKYAKNPGQRYG